MKMYRIVKYTVMLLALVAVCSLRAQSLSERIDAYAKIEIGVPCNRSEFGWRYLQERFGFVLSNIDTSAVTNAAYLPLIQTEIESEIYRRDEPTLLHEQLKRVRVSGIDEDYAITQVGAQLPLAGDFYGKRVAVLGRELPSPLDSARYRYVVVAPSQVAFSPRDEEGFEGVMTLDDKGELCKISAQYKLLTFGAEATPILCRCEVVYGAPQAIESIPRKIERASRRKPFQNWQIESDTATWQSVRPEPLAEREERTFEVVDSVARQPLTRDIYSIGNAIASGYYDRGAIGWGPYDKIVGFNRLERVRFQYGLRTTEQFSRRVRLTAYTAYGVRDAAVKGGGAVEVRFGQSYLQRKLTLTARHDLMQLGAGQNPFVEPKVAKTALVRSNKARASMTNQLTARYDHEWSEGVLTSLNVDVRDIKSNGYVPMLHADNASQRSLRVATIGLSARLSWREMMLRRHFDRYSLGSRYPIVVVDGAFGAKGLLGGEYNFGRVELSALYRLPMGRVGESQLIVNAGGVMGRVPYPLLKIHEANGSVWYDRQAFSCMNYLEFASDAWVGWFYEHHFKGLLLDQIPYLNYLRWHEVVTFKGVYGSLREANRGAGAVMQLPEGMIAPSKPYMEIGVGIENIFKVFRVDAIWRLTHRDRVIEGREVDRFRVNISFQLRF